MQQANKLHCLCFLVHWINMRRN